MEYQREAEMAADGIAAVESVNDPAGIAEYHQFAGPTLEKYGERAIVGGVYADG